MAGLLNKLMDFIGIEDAEMNDVYGSFFQNNPPARTTVQVVGLPKGSAVEIEAIAKK